RGKTATTPLTPEEIDKLTALVQESIGFNRERGDSVRVINAPFRVEPAPVVDELPVWQQPAVHDLLRHGAVPTALALVALAVVFGLVRPALKTVAPPPPAARGGQLAAVVADDPNDPSSPALPALEAPRTSDKLERARQLAKDNPVAVAGIVRGWVSGEAA
ncbi:MAG: flagellar basal body M-ring protein FliF, partial [Burkholderiaceae bacterium]|nr:flagellar basal body M-ring protein FliF [Burkholderiaceae bacterium]